MFIKTVSTTSGINPIKFDETGGVFYWILNTGSSTIYASTKSAFTAGDDGVVSLGPKESRRLETNNDTIYILGAGQVEIHNQRDGICSFKQAPTSSGGGGTIDAYTKTESDAKYASKALYEDTTINVGREAGSVVGDHSTAEGINTTASGHYSHAEGTNTIASGVASHAEGGYIEATGNYSHAEGYQTCARGYVSHAEGMGSTADGSYSHAEGFFAKTTNNKEFACGTFNQSNEDTLFSVGDGTDDNNRHNAFEITKTGGKLHDRDIGISFTQAETAALRIEIPDGVDVAQWLVQNAKSGMMYFILSKASRTGLPNVSADWMWFSYDGNKYFARAWTGATHTSDFVLDAVNSIGGWKEISYTPIKSTTFSGTTNAYGDVLWLSASENKIPLFVDVESKYVIPFRSVGNYWFYMMHATVASHAQPAANVAVSGTVYYVEI